ncbi:efflux transporter outer membrane subunit [Leptospira sp. 2 VSF19]|uniref:Efflux transporter outer membrane subunit n=1 Tax=Leptospira soteropolitanensis TaxID=2950025 RepID=A0AAW5VBN3_9LEPT|nr:efflux transporter outer membrane subunit [Leptospira soteropolitanensis]MCW7491471.1 efflux transporter outer membrane subunit [Leptospira soteropolitanensis]MCW7499055.1 efflux transporter outer membrane subunit [Leptospira soteropolitanensis]MCW7521353.1 efflux transporter outer membrane subunit [Leptospira soteropolitanensis]MCW7525159.1 efflux transporter outer membrane subunit [Leptospira soteropolitanensis]MCW7529026.1 efflux transporter outer membrane subunit [Leptospira soteropolit
MKRIILPILFLLNFSCIPALLQRDKEDLKLPEEFLNWETSEKSEKLVNQIWKEFFKEQQLVDLIEIAIENNQELAILEQEINISNNEVFARQGEYLPKLSIQADGGSEQKERFSTPNANSPTLFAHGGLVMSWEIDIWKKLRNATKSAYLRYLAGIEGKRYVVTNLVAEITDTYFELIALDNQLTLVENYIDVLSKVKDIVVLQREAGRTTSLAVKRFEAEVSKNLARKYDIVQRIAITENRLNFLLGRFPEKIARKSEDFLDISLPEIQKSVPVDLLENRPDIKQATLILESRKLDVEVARARFYPSLMIDGNIGYEAFNSKHFKGTPVSLAYGLGGGIIAPLINRKAIEANYATANNMQIQAIYNYEVSLLKAFTEVTNQIVKIKNLNQKFEAKTKQVLNLKESVEISNILFKAGRIDYIDVLFTQRDFLEAQIEVYELKYSLLESNIGLYKALGGGWRGQKEPEGERKTSNF